MAGARGYIKKIGIPTDQSLPQLQRKLLKSLSRNDQAKVEHIWALRDAGHCSGLELYSIPQNAEQAILLFAVDWPRLVASFDWIDDIVSRSSYEKIAEMGSGPGLLLNFLREKYPRITFQGIDAAENLTRIGKRLSGLSLIAGDYLAVEPDDMYDLIICNFGFDNPNFSPSRSPHSSTTCGPAAYCPGCSDDLKPQVERYMKAWRRWGTIDASLIITGRISEFGMLRAFVLGAQEADWHIALEPSTVLKVKTVWGEAERFPALVFRSGARSNPAVCLEDIARFYVEHR